jgi:hypothetical protein
MKELMDVFVVEEPEVPSVTAASSWCMRKGGMASE